MIHIDYREPKEISAILDSKTVVVRCALSIGDYLTPQGAIERKTIPDLLSSLASRRIFQQTARLSERYNPRYLLIEGLLDWSVLKNPEWVITALRRITLQHGVPILFSSSMGDTARTILKMTGPLVTIDPIDEITVQKKPRSIPRQQEALLMAMPGIGSKRARCALNHFGTPRRFFIASSKEWKSAGIGVKTRCRIQAAIDTPYTLI